MSEQQTTQYNITLGADDLYKFLKEIASRDNRSWRLKLKVVAYDAEGKQLGGADLDVQSKKVLDNGDLQFTYAWTVPDNTAYLECTLHAIICGDYGGCCDCNMGHGFRIDSPPKTLGIIITIKKPSG